jgi:hypothetical protein
MRAAIGLFAMLALLGGIASAKSPGIETAGLFTSLPTVSTGSLLRKAGTVKVQCKCGKVTKTIESDYCPDGVKASLRLQSRSTSGHLSESSQLTGRRRAPSA